MTSRRVLALAAAPALAALAPAGCITTSHNAPGIAQLAAPPRIENGDPAAFEPATSPGQRTLVAIVAPSLLLCAGCSAPGTPKELQPAGELGGEIIVEYRATERGTSLRDNDMRGRAWGLGLGATAGFSHHERAGTFHASVNRRFLVAGMVPGAVNAGIAIATDGMPGIQASVHYLMLMVRARAVADHGAELLFGMEWPIPLVFSWSR